MLVLQKMADGSTIEPFMLAAVAAYYPLHSLPDAASMLRRQWPHSTAALLRQQVQEPIEEMHDRSRIPRLTTIDNSVSIKVQQQYEKNPYPRWTRLPRIGKV